jgi:hypothetical protein
MPRDRGVLGRLKDMITRLGWRIVATAATAITCCSCTVPVPVLNSVVPGTGYPRQLLAVDGTTLFASVVWDPGPNEKVLYNGLFGTSYFQIPTDATAGPHMVALRNNNRTSGTVQVNVLPNQDFRDDPTATKPYFPAPRIEDIGVLLAGGSGPVQLALTIAAANLDVDAKVTITEVVGKSPPVERTVVASVGWSALPVDYLQAHTPSTFGYPVYHYTQLLSIVENVTLGSMLQVTVENTDLKTATRTLPIPVSLDQLDGDGDGLLDSWEEGSYPAPSGRSISLSTMGAHKWKKDILVEVDWIADANPHFDLWQGVEASFSNAPVLNPDGSHGVHIVIDHGQSAVLSNGGEILADHSCLTFANPPPPGTIACPNTQSFFSYKAAHFDPDRLRIFHYAILGRKHANSLASGEGERHGNDFFITPLGSLNFLWPLVGVQVGTFVHELGHNLGFSHGDLTSDDQDYPSKFNLPSVMNYRYTWFGISAGCDLTTGGVYTYSEGTLASLNESSVDESVGICDGQDLDMDGGGVLSGARAIDLNMDGDTNDVSDDFDQWGHLLLKFDTVDSKWHKN